MKTIKSILLIVSTICSGQCPAPSNINIINNILLLNTVEMSWSENGTTSWEIVVLPNFNVGDSLPTVGVVTTSNPYTIVNLPPSYDCYAFFIRSCCSATDVSPWVGVTSSGCSIAAYNWFVTLSNNNFSNYLDNNTLEVFPNPAKNIMYVKNESHVNKIVVYNNLGKAVLTQTTNNNEVNVENLAHGIYLLEIHTEQNKVYKKFIKE